MSSLSDFIKAIRSEAEEIKSRNADSRVSLEAIFADAIQKTLVEIKQGADSRAFPDLVVINFIIKAAQEKYAAPDIKAFADSFTDQHDMSYSEDLEDELPASIYSGESSAQAKATGLPKLTEIENYGINA